MNASEVVEIKYLEKQVSDVDAKVSSILTLLKGNDLDESDRGLIGNIKDHHKRIVALERVRDRLFWFMLGMSIPASWGIIDIIKKILTKN